MTPTLKHLISGISGLIVTGKDTVTVRALATDSRRVVSGSMFIALPGLRTDGHFYVSEAIDRGASVIVCEKDCWVPPNVTLVQTNDLRSFVACVASRFYGHPEKALELTGFLGTSGKTVACTLLKHFLSKDGPLGVLGTINYSVGGRTLPAHRTTPEAIELFGLFAQIKQRECRRVLMEVSAHGIDQKRVEGLQFRNLVLTNLTPEHLNYHGSLEQYVSLEREYVKGQAKGLKYFIAGIDDGRVHSILETAPESLKAKALTFGCSEGATIRASRITYSERDTRFTLNWPEGQVKLVSPLLGEFNLQNTLAAIACGYAEGLDPVQMGADLLSFPAVRGRMERLDVECPFNLVVDYMHTEAAYDKGLDMLRGLTKGRLITIFGCGGNRDDKTRPVITDIVARKSDIAIATADNPRNETIEAIFEDMRRSNESHDNLRFIDDRRAAIAAAIAQARPGDTVLIAGKGHETFQEFGDCVVPFDDRAVALEILKNQQWHNQ
ncbi:UDP-N-acetylmuramoyl-L-alanyl-D-glutamate--2,6-diaminopimelate ligase [Oceanipulchritudo coccoides]|nr:UDP-N-acetylmuramoyl-L-alanyl-D-glutamate--2,6-diaminopimelate ligase [Oceanipulchritudo coccoides]